MNVTISEWQIDVIKESISHYYDAQIDHSQLSYQEKKEQEYHMKHSLEMYIHGVKDEPKAKGKMKAEV